VRSGGSPSPRALELTALVAQKQPSRHGRFAVRWLHRYLQERDPSIDELALVVGCLVAFLALGGRRRSRRCAVRFEASPKRSSRWNARSITIFVAVEPKRRACQSETPNCSFVLWGSAASVIEPRAPPFFSTTVASLPRGMRRGDDRGSRDGRGLPRRPRRRPPPRRGADASSHARTSD
jgi:hypothetical protein